MVNSIEEMDKLNITEYMCIIKWLIAQMFVSIDMDDFIILQLVVWYRGGVQLGCTVTGSHSQVTKSIFIYEGG